MAERVSLTMFHALAQRLRLTRRVRAYGITALIGLVLVVAVGATAVLTTHKAKADTLTATASVNVSNSSNLGAYSPVSYGVNEAAWDGDQEQPGYPQQINNAGVQIMRYPGGSTADNFHWYNQSVQYHADSGVAGSGDLGPNDCSNCGVNFDQFMDNIVQPSGAQAMITVNYGSGTPQGKRILKTKG